MNHLTTSITVSETDCIKSRKSLPLSLMLAAARPSNVHANINPERKYIHKYKTMFTMANSSCNKCMLSSQAILLFWPRVTSSSRSLTRPAPCYKAFQNQDQDQPNVKQSFIMDFHWNLLYLFNYWLLVFSTICLQTRLFGMLSFFMKEKVNVIVATVMEIWAHSITGLTLL